MEAKEMEKTLQPPLQVYQTLPIHGKLVHHTLNPFTNRYHFRARDDGRGFDKPAARTWTSTTNLSAQNETGEYCLFVLFS